MEIRPSGPARWLLGALALALACTPPLPAEDRVYRHAVDRETTDEGPGLADASLSPTPDGQRLESPWRAPGAPFNEVLVSWNVDVPRDSGFRVELRFARDREGAEPSAWYHLGRWGAFPELPATHVEDADGKVEIDCFSGRGHFLAYQYRFTFRAGQRGAPSLRRVTVVTSDMPGSRDAYERLGGPGPAPATRGALQVDVPYRSQRAEPPDLQGRICSPTSITMLLAYRGVAAPTAEVAARAFDRDHDLYGNWPANIQAAYSYGIPGRIARVRSLDAARVFLERGQPLIVSIRDREGVLKGAPYATTQGHLLVLTGFDEKGNVRVNDPAAADAARGVAVYDRSQFEKVWLDQGGVAYVIEKK